MVRGTAEVTIDAQVKIVRENESVYIPSGAIHRLANPGKIPLEIIEVQTGSYLGEDDIERFEDAYNRARSRTKEETVCRGDGTSALATEPSTTVGAPGDRQGVDGASPLR